jgi:inorganic pyrophosphatase
MSLHNVNPGPKVPDEFNVIIEIPMNADPIKYEVDEESGALFVDRFMATSMHYPCNYGYIPKTLADDGDPVDVLVITPVPLIPGVVVTCRPLGMLRMDDEAGGDNKLLAVPIDNDDPEFFHYHSTSCDTARFSSVKNFSENGGVSTDRYTAIAKALGEAVERYCAAIYDPGDLTLARYRDLSPKAVHPGRMTVYRPDQFRQSGFPWVPFTEDSLVHWTPGRSLLSGEQILVPAAAVYIPFHYSQSPGAAPILQPISTGLACGSSFEEAAKRDLASNAFWAAALAGAQADPRRLELIRTMGTGYRGITVAEVQAAARKWLKPETEWKLKVVPETKKQ